MDEYSYSLQQRQGRKTARKGLSRFKLKVLADILLFMSIASTTIVPLFVGEPSADNMTALTAAVICEAISWASIPLYAWFLYTGFRETSNAGFYLLRLVILACVCEVPYDMVTYGKPIDWSSQNPVFGLAIALVVLWLLDSLERYSKSVRIVLSVLVILVGLLWVMMFNIGSAQALINIGVLTLGLCVIYYYFDGKENTMMLTAGMLSAMFMVIPALGVVALHYRNNEYGERHKWTKWAFYAVYPVFLLIGWAVKG